MRTLLLAGLAALGLAGCSTSGPVATSYAPAAYVAAPVHIPAMAYAAEPVVMAPAPVVYRTFAPPLVSAQVETYSYQSEPDYDEPDMSDSYAYSGDTYSGEAESGGCSELVVC